MPAHLAAGDARVVAEAAPRNRNVRNPISQFEYDRLVNTRLWLINVGDRSWQVSRTYGVYWIDAAKKGGYTATEVRGRVENTDEGNDKALQWKHEASDIANDIAREINENIILAHDAVSFMGIGVSETPEPSEEFLDELRGRLAEYQDALVTTGDRLHSDPKTHRDINELHRWACRARGYKRDWLFKIAPQAECPACKEAIQPGVAKCPKCGAVIDMEKLKQFFPIEWAQIQAMQNIAIEVPKDGLSEDAPAKSGKKKKDPVAA